MTYVPRSVGPSETKPIGSMATNLRGDTLRVSIDTFNRTRCLNLRKWFKAANGQELPGKGGFALNVTRLREFAALVNKALRYASEAGLLPRPDDASIRKPSASSPAPASKPKPQKKRRAKPRVPSEDRSDALVEHPVPMVGYPHDQDWAIHHRLNYEAAMREKRGLGHGPVLARRDATCTSTVRAR